MLRDSLLNRIYSALERSSFTVADFEIDQGEQPKNHLLRITFRHQPNFSLVVRESNGHPYTTESPGDHRKTESKSLQSLGDVPDRITVWTRNVRDELRATKPVYRELDRLRELMEQHVQEHVESPEEPFSNAEADELRAKLDSLAASFAQMQERAELTEQELNRLNQELVSIKANLEAFPKGVWYKTAANRLWAAFSKVATSQESRQVLASVAKKALGLDSEA